MDDILQVELLNPPLFERSGGLRNDNEQLKITISQDIFPENWDPYHYKMAVLLDRIIRGEKIAGY